MEVRVVRLFVKPMYDYGANANKALPMSTGNGLCNIIPKQMHNKINLKVKASDVLLNSVITYNLVPLLTSCK